jgi:putative ABC transport system permease protein
VRILTVLRIHVRALFDRRRIDRELDEEFRDHLEREVAARVAAGLPVSEARRTAFRDFGGRQVHKEDSRSRPARWWDDFLADLRYALRSLTREWGFAAVTIVTLALGIGANVTMFSALDAVLLRPLPYSAQHRLLLLRQQDSRNPARLDDVSPANYLDWRERAAFVLDIAAAEPYSRTLTTPDGPERIRAWRVSDGFFDLFGVAPAFGRTFVPGDFVPGRENVLVLGYGTWMRQFGGDAAIAGRVIRVDGQPFTIVGVMPAAFAFPPGRDVWTPKIFTDADRRERATTYLRVVGRLREGIDADTARARLDLVAAQLREEYPRENANTAASAVPLKEALVGGAGRVLGVFLAAVVLLLITACANVGNLLLVRMHRRRQEFGVRTALGAGIGRVRRQVLTESMTIAALGATAAVVLSRWAIALVRTMAPSTLPRAEDMALAPHSVLIAYVLAAVTAAAIGILSLSMFGHTPIVASTTSSRGASSRRSHLQRAFVALQLAIATMLVVAAGLFVRSLATLLAEERGFRIDRIVAVTLFAWQEFPKPEQRAEFVHQVVERLESVPGVVSAGAGSSLPLAERVGPETATFTLPDVPATTSQAPSAQSIVTSPGYFETLGIALRDGRTFTWFDGPKTKPVVIVNERLARQHWRDRSPIGHSIVVRFAGPPVAREIVGVVADAKRELAREAPPAFYIPHAQSPTGSLSFVVHTSQEPPMVVPAIKAAIRTAGPETALSSITTLDGLLDATLSPRRFILGLVGFFAGAALLVGAIGTYGVVACSTAERTKEIGIRMALGGSRGHVVRAVIGEGLRMAGVGVLAGVALAFGVSRFLADLLYGITPADWPTYAIAALTLVAITLLACATPAWRASRFDPLTVLRGE